MTHSPDQSHMPILWGNSGTPLGHARRGGYIRSAEPCGVVGIDSDMNTSLLDGKEERKKEEEAVSTRYGSRSPSLRREGGGIY